MAGAPVGGRIGNLNEIEINHPFFWQEMSTLFQWPTPDEELDSSDLRGRERTTLSRFLDVL